MSDALQRELELFAQRHPEQAELAAEFSAFLARGPQTFSRSHAAGHFTGSVWLVDAEGQHALLTLHRKLNRWLQPGGHADGDCNLARVAAREAEEESGISGLQLLPDLFDIDRHRIPTRGEEAEHWHWDVRYVLVAAPNAQFSVGAESLDLAWVPISRIAAGGEFDASMVRMARRWISSLSE